MTLPLASSSFKLQVLLVESCKPGTGFFKALAQAGPTVPGITYSICK